MVYRRIVRFQLYDTEMVGPLSLYGIAQGIDELDAPVLFVGHVLGRDGTVKNHVCMCRAGHNAQVVDVGQRREFLDLTLQNAFSSSA